MVKDDTTSGEMSRGTIQGLNYERRVEEELLSPRRGPTVSEIRHGVGA